MDIREGLITIRELRENPRAKWVLDQHLPGLLDMQIAILYPSMTLNALMSFSHVPDSKIDTVLIELINL